MNEWILQQNSSRHSRNHHQKFFFGKLVCLPPMMMISWWLHRIELNWVNEWINATSIDRHTPPHLKIFFLIKFRFVSFFFGFVWIRAAQIISFHCFCCCCCCQWIFSGVETTTTTTRRFIHPWMDGCEWRKNKREKRKKFRRKKNVEINKFTTKNWRGQLPYVFFFVLPRQFFIYFFLLSLLFIVDDHIWSSRYRHDHYL